MEQNDSFKTTYSARQQEEIRAIRQKNLLDESKMDKLRALDAQVTKKAAMVSIIVGIIGLIPVALAYPIYHRTLKKEREKIAPTILYLTNELMK